MPKVIPQTHAYKILPFACVCTGYPHQWLFLDLFKYLWVIQFIGNLIKLWTLSPGQESIYSQECMYVCTFKKILIYSFSGSLDFPKTIHGDLNLKGYSLLRRH